MKGYLLDTHVLLWWLSDPEKLSPSAQTAIADPEQPVYASAAVGWEIAIKTSLGRLVVPKNLVEAIRETGIRFLPITSRKHWASAICLTTTKILLTGS